MEPEFWLQRWQEQMIGFHQENYNRYLIDFWHRLNVVDGATILVPLCGKSKDMLWLRDQGYQVVGIEISDIAVQDFFSENDLSPSQQQHGKFILWQCEGISIYQGDFFDIGAAELEKVEAVFDRAALIALPELMRKDYVTKLQQCLPSLTPILLICLQYPQNEMDGPPFAVNGEEVEKLFHGHFSIECCCEVDSLAQNPQFRERGLSQMLETAYLLRPKH